jgi:hypothetical protein
MFQHFNTLILTELLSSSDFKFICQLKDTFLALDNSACGSISFDEFKTAFSREVLAQVNED